MLHAVFPAIARSFHLLTAVGRIPQLSPLTGAGANQAKPDYLMSTIAGERTGTRSNWGEISFLHPATAAVG